MCSRSESSRTAGDDKCVHSFSSEPTSLICSRPPFECEDLSWSAISDSLPEPGDPSAAAASCKMSLLFSALAKAARVAPTVSSASPGGDAPETPGAPELAAPVSPCPRAGAILSFGRDETAGDPPGPLVETTISPFPPELEAVASSPNWRLEHVPRTFLYN